MKLVLNCFLKTSKKSQLGSWFWKTVASCDISTCKIDMKKLSFQHTLPECKKERTRSETKSPTNFVSTSRHAWFISCRRYIIVCGVLQTAAEHTEKINNSILRRYHRYRNRPGFTPTVATPNIAYHLIVSPYPHHRSSQDASTL